MSQELLASRLGVTFQQLQKYENGVNRVSAGRLAQIATVLSVNIGDFFEGIVSSRGHDATLGQEAFSSDPIAARLVKIWGTLSPELKSGLALLAETIAAQAVPAIQLGRRRHRTEPRSLAAVGK